MTDVFVPLPPESVQVEILQSSPAGANGNKYRPRKCENRMMGMHTDKIGNATDEQYSGFEPCMKGTEWVTDAEGTRKVSESWRCYFGGGETLDIDGDGAQDTLVKGEINVEGTCFFYVRVVQTATYHHKPYA